MKEGAGRSDEDGKRLSEKVGYVTNAAHDFRRELFQYGDFFENCSMGLKMKGDMIAERGIGIVID